MDIKELIAFGKRIYFWLLCALLIIAVIYGRLYGFTTAEMFNLFIKPITVIQIALFLMGVLVIDTYLYKLKNSKKAAIIICFLLLMLFGFEVLWSFFFWFSTYEFAGVQANIDALNYTPNNEYQIALNNATLTVTRNEPVSLNYAAKMNMLAFFLALYLLYQLILLEYSERNLLKN